jgi:hypothetical protein
MIDLNQFIQGVKKQLAAWKPGQPAIQIVWPGALIPPSFKGYMIQALSKPSPIASQPVTTDEFNLTYEKESIPVVITATPAETNPNTNTNPSPQSVSEVKT